MVSWISFVVPPDVIPGRMALLITLFLVLVNIFNSVTTNTPKAEGNHIISHHYIIIKIIRVWVCIAKIQILVYCDMRMYSSYVGDERPIQWTIKFIHWSVNTKDWFLIIWWSSFCSAALLFLQAAKWNFPSERTVIFVYTVLFKLVYYPNKALFLL